MVDFKGLVNQTEAENTAIQERGDLFQWLDALWTKKQLEGAPPLRVMHRFLASDPDYAQAARVLIKEVREPDLVIHIWQGLLPKGRGAPRLQYVGAKRPPDAEELVTRMMVVRGERRDVVEATIEMVRVAAEFAELGGGEEAIADLYRFYGVERGKK